MNGHKVTDRAKINSKRNAYSSVHLYPFLSGSTLQPPSRLRNDSAAVLLIKADPMPPSFKGNFPPDLLAG
jgi:hypothetical protein